MPYRMKYFHFLIPDLVNTCLFVKLCPVINHDLHVISVTVNAIE